MKKTILLIIISIGLGISFTIFFLNNENIYAKEEYLVYVFQAGAYESFDNASSKMDSLTSGIMLYEDGLYKIYTAIYKDIDIVNKLVLYFENNNVDVYIKTLIVNKKFYNELNNYEKIVKEMNDFTNISKVNQSILNSYLESDKND